MAQARKARAVGFNHVALEVGDIDEAPVFYGRLFDFELRSRCRTDAFIDLGDQFLALQKGRRQPADDGRHVGLVVDDRQACVPHSPKLGRLRNRKCWNAELAAHRRHLLAFEEAGYEAEAFVHRFTLFPGHRGAPQMPKCVNHVLGIFRKLSVDKLNSMI